MMFATVNCHRKRLLQMISIVRGERLQLVHLGSFTTLDQAATSQCKTTGEDLGGMIKEPVLLLFCNDLIL